MRVQIEVGNYVYAHQCGGPSEGSPSRFALWRLHRYPIPRRAPRQDTSVAPSVLDDLGCWLEPLLFLFVASVCPVTASSTLRAGGGESSPEGPGRKSERSLGPDGRLTDTAPRGDETVRAEARFGLGCRATVGLARTVLTAKGQFCGGSDPDPIAFDTMMPTTWYLARRSQIGQPWHSATNGRRPSRYVVSKDQSATHSTGPLFGFARKACCARVMA